MPKQIDLLQGTLEMLILKAVSFGPLHGYGVLQRIVEVSGDQLVIQQGSLYPALYRLEAAGALATNWATSDNNRRAKFYALTTLGQRQLLEETARWRETSRIIGAILRLTADATGIAAHSEAYP